MVVYLFIYAFGFLVRFLRSYYKWMDYVAYFLLVIVPISALVSNNDGLEAFFGTAIFISLPLYFIFGFNAKTKFSTQYGVYYLKCKHCGYHKVSVRKTDYHKTVSIECERCGKITDYTLETSGGKAARPISVQEESSHGNNASDFDNNNSNKELKYLMNEYEYHKEEAEKEYREYERYKSYAEEALNQARIYEAEAERYESSGRQYDDHLDLSTAQDYRNKADSERYNADKYMSDAKYHYERHEEHVRHANSCKRSM